MEEDYIDISQTGSQGYRNLQQQNDNYFDDGFISLVKPSSGEKSDKNKKSETNADVFARNMQNLSEHDREVFEKYYEENPWDLYTDSYARNVVDYAQTMGDRSYREIGKNRSKYDDRIYDVSDWANIDNYRGKMQSGAEQLANGLGKMAVIAGTTALDNFVGTAAGIINLATQGIQGNINSWADAGDAFVSNPVSKYLIGINDKSEEWMPNYYTDEERNAPWYQQFWHANFIGDHFMKNTGFMVGALLSGRASAGVLSKVMKTNQARNIFKSTALAAGLENTSPNDVLNAYKTGKAIGSVDKVSDALAQAAKNAKRADVNLKLASSAIASFGESRMEAITNSNDWFERNKTNLDQMKAQQLQNLDAEIAQDHPELFRMQAVIGPEGDLRGYQRVVADKYAYNGIYNQRRQEVEDRYNGALANMSKQRVDYANASFLTNFVLTSAENFNLLGDAMIGSWSKRAGFNNRIKQKLKDEGVSAAAKEVADVTGDAVKTGIREFKANPMMKAWDITKGIVRGPVFEGTQEMFQQGTTTALNRRAGSRLNSYYGDIIDKDGLDYVTGGMRNFVGAIKDTYADPEQWENFAIGAITALLPLPTQVRTTNQQQTQRDENGKLSINDKIKNFTSQWRVGGEMWDAIREARQNYNQADALAQALNKIENDGNRLNQFYDIVKQKRLNELKQQALDNGDQKSYKDLENEGLASIVMTYSDAGQMDYLRELVEEAYTIETPEQIESLRSFNMYDDPQPDGSNVQKSLFDGMSDDEIREYYASQKQKVLDKINKFDEIYNNVNELYGDFGGDQSQAYRRTLAYKIMGIDDRESRIKDISGQLLEQVKEYAEKLRKTLPQQVEGYDDAIQQLTDIHNLDIAFGEDGIIQKLEQKQHEFLSKRNEQFNELLSELDEFNQVVSEAQKEGKAIDEERYGTFEQVQNRIKELTRSLNWVRGRRNMISNSRKDIDFYTSLNDLTKLLAEREMLYMDLALLSGMDGKDVLDHSMMIDIIDTMGKYDEKENQRIYEEYKKSGILDTFGRSISDIADVAKRNNDEQVAKELGQYAKYQSIFNTDTIDMDSPYVSNVFNNVIQILRDNKDLTVDEMDKAVQDYLDEETDDEEINNIKNIISSRIKAEKQREQDEQQAKDGVEHEDEEKESDDINSTKRKLKKFFAGSEEDLNEYLNGFESVDDLQEQLRKDGLYDAVDNALIEFVGMGFDELGNDYNSVKDAISVARSNAYNDGYFNDIEDKSQDIEEEPEEEPEESTPKKSDKKQPAPKPQGQPEARVEGDFVVSGSGSRVTFEDDSDNPSPDPNTIIVGETIGAQDMSEKTVLSRNKGKDKELVKEELNDGNSQDYVEKRRNNRRTDAWDVNRYGIWSTSGLKRNALERFEPSESDLKYQGNNISTVYSNLVRQAKCQEFIDNGLLDRVLKYFDKTDPSGKRKRIRFVAITDKSLIGDSYEAVNFVKNRIPLAAIELTKKDIENIIKEERDDKTRALLQKQFEDNTNLIQFNGQHGVKTFQVLGVVTPEGFNSSSGTYLEEKVDGTKYNKFKDAAFQEFITEFKKNIEQKPAGKVEYDINGGTRNFGYYKYSDFTSEVEYIYTGRLIKENSSKKADELVYLGDILTDSQLENPEGHLQVTVLFDNNVDQNDPTDRSHLDFGRRLGGQVVPLNTNFFENTVRQEVGQTRKGTVWILTREADGNVYYKGCRVQSFNRAWYDENKGNPDNFYIKSIRRLLQNIAKNYSDVDEIKRNLNNLQNLIYLDDNHSIWVGKNGTFRVGKSTDNQIDLTEGTIDEVVDNMIETLFNSNPSGYRFALTSERLTLKQIIDSNILKTDLAQLHNTGASFAISKLSKQDTGDFEVVPSETFKVVRQMGYRHTGTIGQDPNRNTVDLTIGDDTFTVRKEKGELEYYLNGKKVPKNRKNYYKALFEAYVKAFNDQDREKNSLFRFRGSGLYAYEFNASLNDDRTYGVVFSTNQDHKHYRLSQDEVMLLKKVKRQKDSLTKKEAEDLIKLFDRIGAKHYKWMDGEVGVKKGERKPSVDSEEQIEKHRKTLQERYGKDYPNIGDTISYRLAKIGKDGQIEFGDVITETITGYNKNSNIVTENGNTITKGELDLFYGVSRNMPTIGRNNGQYRHIVTKNNIQTQFTTDDKFDDVEKPKQEKPAETEPTRQGRRGRSQNQSTTQTVGGVSTQGNEDPTGVFNYGNRTLLQQKLSPFWMQHKNEIADIVRNSGKQGKFFDLIVQSSSKELKEQLLAKIQNSAFNKEDANRLLDLIRDIIECK